MVNQSGEGERWDICVFLKGEIDVRQNDCRCMESTICKGLIGISKLGGERFRCLFCYVVGVQTILIMFGMYVYILQRNNITKVTAGLKWSSVWGKEEKCCRKSEPVRPSI